MDESVTKKPLTRPEAGLVVRWLSTSKGVAVPGGRDGLWKLTPTQVAERYKVKIEDIVNAARLNISTS